jgi:FkbH-like protein
MYAQERLRRQFIPAGSSEDYLASLKMTMKVCFDDVKHLTRLTQLTQKTNQFNLTTRRYDEQQMQQFMRASSWIVADFSLADIFGDSGIVGLALVRLDDGKRAELDTFLMSCRVIGREAESAFLNVVLRRLVERGIMEVRASYIPTQKNGLVRSFLPEHGFENLGESKYRRDLRRHPPKDDHVFPIAVSIHSAVPDRLSTTNP